VTKTLYLIQLEDGGIPTSGLASGINTLAPVPGVWRMPHCIYLSILSLIISCALLLSFPTARMALL
jgi:hypothetical protein